ncbi:endo alpha-1,4 polygalactosaminidase [Actinophytocola oryzae]|uniref:Glycosyl hydrolase family 114 n=1 Tax=Actinophytocola oryzae TaxID=502181 RepID=A0A4R7VXP9_9PSEU|nr:endo alpha-1,4 polygalactosaminidase [Actinophytocola oryzae]TDV54923.1 glycosyl hydrolase family 114 [Actinophytocola oryzae]
MMTTRARVLPLVGAVVAALFVTADASAAVSLPPAHARFDYQIGGAYTPPSGVRVVSRDHGDAPAAGLYNICYVNAFQAQPDTEGEWGDLLLRDSRGDIVYDEDWGEAMLDIRTAAKRERIAAKVDAWIDQCAAKGFRAVEPDNFDTFTRAPDNLLTANQAQAYIKLLSAHAHGAGLAIAQKNTVELAGNRVANGLDFAVAEECAEWTECGDYVDAFGNNVIIIEYSARGLRAACADFGSTLSVVRRDVDVSTPDSSDYVYQTC